MRTRDLLPRRLRRTRRPLRSWLRAPAVHWGAAAVLALVTWSSLRDQRTAAEQLAARWGPTVGVVVLRDDHRAGDVLSADDVELRDVPRSLAPPGAVTSLRVTGRLRVDVVAGEILVRDRVTASAGSSLAAAVPSGWRALAVPQPLGGMDLAPGDRVDLLAITADGASEPIASGGLVLAATAEALTVAVPRDRAGAVADAVVAATLTVSLVGPE